jgi:DTW domain-containing protein YfiP
MEAPASLYRIRKAHRPEQLSTLEATCYALMQLEGNAQKYAPLLQAFAGFVEQYGALAERRGAGAGADSGSVQAD